MIVTHKIIMDLGKRGIVPRVDAVQDDKYSRNLEFTLTANGGAWSIPDSATAIVRFRKSDGTGGNYDTLPDGTQAYTINGNVLTVALAPQACTAPGLVQLAVGLIDGETEINTFTICVNVQANPGLSVTSEGYYKVIGSLAASGWEPNMYLGTDAEGKVVAVEAPDSSKNVYIGPDEPTGDNRPLYWLDTSGDSTGEDTAVYTVISNLTNVTIDNTADSVNEGESYAAAIIAVDGYVLSSVTVTMGGVDITSNAYANGNIYIASVTGNIVITAVAAEVSEEVKTYTITNNLLNIATDNATVSVEENASYIAKLTVADGYKLDTVTVKMNGVDVTADVYADGVITIEAVTGDVVITATTVKQSEYNTAVAVVETNFTGNLYEDDGETVITSSIRTKRITSEAFDSDTEVEITLSMTSTSYSGMYVQSYDGVNSKFYRRETFPKNGDQYFYAGNSYTYIYTIKAGCKLSFTVGNDSYAMFNIAVMRKG